MFELIPFAGRRSTVWDPFKEIDEMEKKLFNSDSLAFRTDVKETDDSYVLEAELPGFKKEDIAIDIEDNYLTISAKREYKKEDKDKHNYIRRERAYGSFTRSFDITGIDSNSITAAYKDGVLSLTLPKEKIETPDKRRLQID